MDAQLSTAGDVASRWHDGALLGLVFATVLVAVLLLAVCNMRATVAETSARNETLGEALATANRTLAQLQDELNDARDFERARIARDLHDDLSCVLVALQLELSGGRRAPVAGEQPRRRRAAADLVEHGLDSLHRVIANLKRNIEDDGVWLTLRREVQAFERIATIDCQLEIPGHVPEPRADVADTVYRVVREALANIARHAEASAAEVRVVCTERDLEVVVLDDGRGIADEQLTAAQSYGLMNMRERAQGVGGSLAVARGVGGGTMVHLRVPDAFAHGEVLKTAAG